MWQVHFKRSEEIPSETQNSRNFMLILHRKSSGTRRGGPQGCKPWDPLFCDSPRPSLPAKGLEAEHVFLPSSHWTSGLLTWANHQGQSVLICSFLLLLTYPWDSVLSICQISTSTRTQGAWWGSLVQQQTTREAKIENPTTHRSQRKWLAHFEGPQEVFQAECRKSLLGFISGVFLGFQNKVRLGYLNQRLRFGKLHGVLI